MTPKDRRDVLISLVLAAVIVVILALGEPVPGVG